MVRRTETLQRDVETLRVQVNALGTSLATRVAALEQKLNHPIPGNVHPIARIATLEDEYRRNETRLADLERKLAHATSVIGAQRAHADGQGILVSNLLVQMKNLLAAIVEDQGEKVKPVDHQNEHPRGGDKFHATLLVVGNPIDGIEIYGPFPSTEDAVRYAEDTNMDDWWLATLLPPR